MKTDKTTLEQIADILQQLTELKITAAAHLLTLMDKVQTLEAAGLVDATPSYKEGKYLYLVSPMVNGQRQRVYVGSDPEKIKVSLQKVQNYKDHIIAKSNLETYQSRLFAALQNLQAAAVELTPGPKPPRRW